MKANKLLSLLVVVLLAVSLLASCGGDGNVTAESLIQGAESALEGTGVKAVTTMSFELEGEDLPEETTSMMNQLSGLSVEIVLDGENVMVKATLATEGGEPQVMSFVTVVDGMAYIESMGTKIKMDATTDSFKDSFDMEGMLTAAKAPILADFNDVSFTKDGGKYVVTAKDLKENAEGIFSMLDSFMGGGAEGLELSNLKVDFTIADGKYETIALDYEIDIPEVALMKVSQSTAYTYGVTVSAPADADSYEEQVNVMTFDDFMAAEVADKVIIDTYVQDKQGWWEKEGVGVATFYTQDHFGGYLLYEMPCTKAEYDQLVAGTPIRVWGEKAQYAGLNEVMHVTKFQILEDEDPYVADPIEMNNLLTADDLDRYQTMKARFEGAKVVAKVDEDGEEHNFFYGWNNAGSEGGDIYFDVEIDGKVYTFVIESYFTGSDTDTYKAALALKAGDIIDIEGYVYWYNGIQPHVSGIAPVTVD